VICMASADVAVGSELSRPVTRARGLVRPGAVIVVVGIALLVIGSIWDLTIGAVALSPGSVLHGLFSSSGDVTSAIVQTIRLPRVVLAVVVGLCTAIAGVIMQGATANPLGAPDVVGVSSGAALVVVVGATVFAQISGTLLVLLGFLGAGVAAVCVMVVAGIGQGRTNPVRLALAGVTVTAMLLAFTQALLLLHQNGTSGVFFWLVGGVNYAQWSQLLVIAPWVTAGVLGALLLAGPMNLLMLGDDTARGLGLNVERVRVLGVLCVVCLAGSTVAVAGPVAFVGIIVPHITRSLVGTDHRVVIPLSGLLGAGLLVLADVACRYVQFPFETPTGIITALVGAPFFLYLARSRKVVA